MSKSAEAFRTISEVADELEIAKHVLRFWENRFPQIKPMKRGGGRRYYRPEDMDLLRGIRHLLHNEGYTIRGVQKILRQQGIETVKLCWQSGAPAVDPDAGGGMVAVTGGRKSSAGSVSTRRGDGHDGRGLPVVASRDPRTVIAAAMRELEACRALLSGRKVRAVAEPVAGVSRRRAKPGA